MAILNGKDAPIETVNFHVWQPCNMRCRFCFATFRDVRRTILPDGHLAKDEAEAVVSLLAEAGFAKITFAGGEPLLCPWITDLVRLGKNHGLTTSLVTNGSLLNSRAMKDLQRILDWITISIDSINPETLARTGRITGGSPGGGISYLDLCHKVKAAGFRLKINTVVTMANRLEDLTRFMVAAQPERWKIFQALPVWGQNSDKVEPLLVTDEQFMSFVGRHRPVEAHGITLIPESNDMMTGSYAMLDPAGRFFDAVGRGYAYSDSILRVGVREAISQIIIDRAKFLARGGRY